MMESKINMTCWTNTRCKDERFSSMDSIYGYTRVGQQAKNLHSLSLFKHWMPFRGLTNNDGWLETNGEREPRKSVLSAYLDDDDG